MNEELTLVSRILSGDAEAWNVFCELYSPIIEKSIRRYVRDSEAGRNLYVSLLEKLRQNKLRSFQGKCTLAGWLFSVVRNHCRDYYRSEGGVRYISGALKDLRPEEQRFFTLFYIQGLSLHDVYESMRSEAGGQMSYVNLMEYDEAIRRKVAKKKLAKLTERLLRPDASYYRGRATGPESEGRETETLAAAYPEDLLESMHAAEATQRLRDVMERLPHQDRLILMLKFEDRLSAREIGEIVNLGNERQVYKRIERLLKELRKMLSEGGLTE